MVKQLTRVGNSQAIVIDKTLLRLLEVNEDASFKVMVENGRLILEPLSAKSYDEEILKVAKSISKKQSKVLKKLAE